MCGENRSFAYSFFTKTNLYIYTMNAIVNVLDNPYVTIQNQEIDICYRKRNYRIALDKISKMYLTKKKASHWYDRFLTDDDYDLCIKTQDNDDITIKVKAFEKQYFIDPIAVVRKLKSK